MTSSVKISMWRHTSMGVVGRVKAQLPIIGSNPNICLIARQPDTQPSFLMGDPKIEMITFTRYLGVQIDRQPSWTKQVRTIKTKSLQALGLLRNNFHLMLLTKCMEDLLSRYLRCCCSKWGCSS